MGQQADGALKVIAPVKGQYALQIAEGRSVVFSFHGAKRAPIEGVGMVGARGNGFVKAFAGPDILLLIKKEIAQLFEISGRRIIHDGELQLTDPLAPRK